MNRLIVSLAALSAVTTSALAETGMYQPQVVAASRGWNSYYGYDFTCDPVNVTTWLVTTYTAGLANGWKTFSYHSNCGPGGSINLPPAVVGGSFRRAIIVFKASSPWHDGYTQGYPDPQCAIGFGFYNWQYGSNSPSFGTIPDDARWVVYRMDYLEYGNHVTSYCMSTLDTHYDGDGKPADPNISSYESSCQY